MNQSISNALLFNLVTIFVVVLIAFFVGSLSYSKASKVKNRIIEEIEKYGEPAVDSRDAVGIANAYSNARGGILDWLDNGGEGNKGGIGYRKITNGTKRSCPTVGELQSQGKIPSKSNSEDVTNKAGKSSGAPNYYEFCVYRVQQCNGSGNGCYTYYHVITYMYFDVPVIEDLVRIPVTGETMGFPIRDS